ncbi:MAG: GGDEF domain-containing protein [Gammaproteobacteria bacterium HGW-Gammaproteobacteria-2]|jgi:diguanylate cyclase (GGDEF)-like protein|nr:MAG: GGDEF domain-containing protein [Gammaproteobacteria bacterium HGW-Gammaproteobacteria-2]
MDDAHVTAKGPPRFKVLLPILLGMAANVLALAPDKPFHQYVQERWSTQAGLPQVSGNAITQDGMGYIWVGTQTGLARFDGTRFTTFTPANTPELPGVWIRVLRTDAKGALWVGTYQGVAVHDERGFRTITAPAGMPAPDVQDIAFAANGAVFVATEQGVFTVIDDRMQRLDSAPQLARAIWVNAEGVWIGSVGGVVRIKDGVSHNLQLPHAMSDVAITALREVGGRLWLGSRRGLFVRDGESWRQVPLQAPGFNDGLVTFLHDDRDGNLWVGTGDGLIRLRDGHPQEWVDARSPGYIKAPLSAFEDREGNLWVGSQSEGVVRLWSGWARRYSASEGLHEPLLWSISSGPDSKLWVGTNDGLALWSNGRFKTVVSGEQLPHPQAYSLLAETDQVWIGTRSGLALWRDGQVRIPEGFAAVANAQINGIARDPGDAAGNGRGDLWLATSEGVFRLRDNHLTHLQPEATDARIGVRYLLRRQDGTWLAGGRGGVWRLKDDRMLPFLAGDELPTLLDVTALYELPDGQLLIGGLTEHVYVFDGAHWHSLTPEQGLPANVPFFVTQADGFVWMAGIRGISRVPVADLQAFVAGKRKDVRGEMILNERGDLRSGQQGSCCNGAGNAKGVFVNEALWLPSRDGMVVLSPQEVVKNAVALTVFIERVRIGEHWHDILSAKFPQLQAGVRDVAFAFAALSYKDPRSTLIRYRLKGYDRRWHTLADGGPRQANYTNLPPGNYTFEVRAANDAGVWVAQPAQLAFTVPPLWHETASFRITALLAVLALLVVAARRVLRRHQLHETRLQQLVDQRTAELRHLNERLSETSQTDQLTGLRNRRFLESQMPADIGFYDREHPGLGKHERIMLFALLDLDHFKIINDQYGHLEGDRVLQQVAQQLQDLLRAGDYVVRWGGEEFLLIFRPMPNQSLAVIGERLCRQIAAHPFALADGRSVSLTASVGLAEYPLFQDAQARLGWEDMIELADKALYWVKRHGRNGWAAFRPTERTVLATLIARLRAGAEPMLLGGELQLLGSAGVVPVLDDPGPAPRPPPG